MNKILLASFGLFAVFTSAQSQGNGISKYTRGASDPLVCLKFFDDVLSGTDAPDECTNNKCECATQGRAQISGGTRLTTNGPPPGGQTFGTHAINCTYHPYGEYSLKDIEDKMSAEVNDFKGYNQHLDSHLGIWAPELSTYISKLGETPYHKMSFKHEESTYYSIITQACAGYYVELITDNAPEDKDSYTLVDEPRLDFTDFTRPSKQEVVKVSRATTLLDEMVHFYTQTIEGSVLQRKTTDDGTEFAIVKLNNAGVQLHFVNRPAPASAQFSVKDLETYVNSVHDQYVKSVNCGFDQHADHHWAYDSQSWTETLSTVSKKLAAGGYKYRWFGLPGGMYQIYAFDPSGWTFQLDLQPGNDTPSTSASYSAACKSDDGCYGQGLCDNISSPFFQYETSAAYFLY